MKKRRPRKRFLSNYKFRLDKTRKPKFRFINKRIVETGKIYTKVFHDQFCCIVWIKHQKKFRLINVLKLSEEGLKKLVAKKRILNKKRCNHLLTFPGKNICDVLRNKMRRNREEFEGFSILKTKLDHVSRLLLRFIEVPTAGKSNKSSTFETSSETPPVEAIPLNSPGTPNHNQSVQINSGPEDSNETTQTFSRSQRKRKLSIFLDLQQTTSMNSPHQCPICTKYLSSWRSLKKHKKTHQTNRQLYPCEKCQRNFTSLRNVKRHQRVAKICSGSPNFTCSRCGAKLQSNLSLVRHLKNNSCRLYKSGCRKQKIEITKSGPDSIDKLEDNLKNAQAVLDSRKQQKLSGKYNEDDSKKLQNSLEIAKKLVSLIEVELTERIEENIEEESDSGFIQEESSFEKDAENSLENQEDEILLNSDENLEAPRKRKKMNQKSENVEDEVRPESSESKRSRLTLCPYCGVSFCCKNIRKHKENMHSDMKEFPCSFCSKMHFTDRAKKMHEKKCQKKISFEAGTEEIDNLNVVENESMLDGNLEDTGYLEEPSSNFEGNASSSGNLHANETRNLEEDVYQKSVDHPKMLEAQEQSAELPGKTNVTHKTSLGKIKARRPSQSFVSIRQRHQSVEFYSPCQRNSNTLKLEPKIVFSPRFRVGRCVCMKKGELASSTAMEPKVLVHRLISRHVCYICNRPTQSRKALLTHMDIHNKDRQVFYCSKCNMKFYTKSNVDKHEERCCDQNRLKKGPKWTKKYCKYCFGICGIEKRNDTD